MCPICITTAVLIASGVAGTGGLAAVAMRKSGGTNAADHGFAPTGSKEAGTPSDRAVQERQQASEQYQGESSNH
jgi:hypothetical protein